jgi:S1-C subfamily serine protease
VILAVDGKKVVRPDDLARYIAVLRPGQKVTLEVLHDDGGRDDVEVTLGKRPDGGGAR